eukprot:CAMPEP_0116969962 /NCGR_PEP_ID=MMETSP0467-20121206/52264_1 /TAXON_ID=283647 /ORGANISM="Mesodinium pulex, Strain SPMC105" /LENGTH=65 /DNA_ID=CAMNT_0004660773 /DNA_START=34 /DNA_END=231 /DNA_ORIENTATION=+
MQSDLDKDYEFKQHDYKTPLNLRKYGKLSDIVYDKYDPTKIKELNVQICEKSKKFRLPVLNNESV